MKLTVTVDPRRGMLRVQADDATAYPPGRVALRVGEAADRALHRLAVEAAAARAEPEGYEHDRADQHHRPDEHHRADEHRRADAPGDVAEHAAARDVPAVPQQRRAPGGTGGGSVRAAAAGRDERVTRRRALRLLDQGHTVEEAAERLGVDPDLVNVWDDDAATDAYTDLLADGFGWPHTAAVS